jgi:lipoyl(octanoyl) transferase
MIIHNLGEMGYVQAREIMQDIHSTAVEDEKNHLILCSHPNIFTVGKDEKRVFGVKTIQCDRGGSITAHTPGQNIFYFCFQAKNPAHFYKKVLLSFEDFFMQYLPEVKYDKINPGFYIQKRKIASLGFRYSQGVSLHGVALNVDVDLAFHSRVNPCALEGIVPTSLSAEGVLLMQDEVNRHLCLAIGNHFDNASI